MTRHACVFGVVLLLGGFFALPGCGNKGSTDGSGSGETAVEKAGEADDAAKRGDSEAAKKYLLRYKLTEGQRSTLVMKMESLGGTAAVPPMTMKIDSTFDTI